MSDYHNWLWCPESAKRSQRNYQRGLRGKITDIPLEMLGALATGVVEEKMAMLKAAGIGGFYPLGNTSEILCQIPAALNRIGIV